MSQQEKDMILKIITSAIDDLVDLPDMPTKGQKENIISSLKCAVIIVEDM